MIKASNLTKQYSGFAAINDLSFSIGEGEICGLLGPNGAGKTTTMRILTGFMPPSGGIATVAGFDVERDPMEVKRRVGYLPESTPLYPEMRISEYLSFAAEAKGLKGAHRRSEVDAAMEAVKVTGRRGSLVGHLSKGLKQRVGLAQALLGDPEVLILDEPTIGLDPEQISDIRSLIKELAGKRTVIISTHILPEVQMICSRVLIMNGGKVIADDTPDNLAKRFEGHGAITLGVVAPPDEARQAFGELPEVSEVIMTGNDTDKITITPVNGANANRAVIGLIANRGWELIHFGGASLSLEEIYLKLVTEESATSSEDSAI